MPCTTPTFHRVTIIRKKGLLGEWSDFCLGKSNKKQDGRSVAVNLNVTIVITTVLSLVCVSPLQAIDLLNLNSGQAVNSTNNNQQQSLTTTSSSQGNSGSFIQQLFGGIMTFFSGNNSYGGFMGLVSRLLGAFGINFGTRYNGIGNAINTGTNGNNTVVPGSNIGTQANGVLNLPIMRQGAGGSEAAVRGCGPTSLLMAIGCGDPSKIQGVLEEVCDRPGGLRYGDAVKWLHKQGYTGSKQYNNWTVEKLQQATMTNKTPVICSIKNERTGNGHIVVVTGVTQEGVHINDPGPGQKKVVPFDEWNRIWKHRDELAIVVSK